MLATILSGAFVGVDAYIVQVEVDISDGFSAFSTVGLPDSAIRESKDRVMAAIKNSNYHFPTNRITVNLAPAYVRKEGSAFDLPIALGLLTAAGQIRENSGKYLVVGELALDGNVRGVHGCLPMAIGAKQNGLEGVILPADNAQEAAIVDNLDIYPVSSLQEAIDFLNGDLFISPFRCNLQEVFSHQSEHLVGFEDVKGQEYAKRAIEVAAAGGHNLLMIGPPGSGKTMLARRIPTILPDMTLDEALETTKIHSIMGFMGENTSVIVQRPYRSPHHTISDAGLIGGGQIPKPGEVSLAHNGVLFLDELPEFRKNVLEVMRQPLEDFQVTISRSAASITYPSNFMLVAAMNPCSCGFFGDLTRECKCRSEEIQRYISKISGPLLDRIDIQVEVPAVKYEDLSSDIQGESSQEICQRVQTARKLQQNRFGNMQIHSNANMQPQQIRHYCQVEDDSQKLLEIAIERLGMSARAYDRILKVSRTIADLDGNKQIQPSHVSEAIQYRSLDRDFWSK